MGVLKWDTKTFMLKWNASEASRKKLKLNCREQIIIIECERSEPKKSKNWRVASEASGKFLKTALFPPILASLGQIIYFLSRIGQIIYFQYFEGQNIYFQKVPVPPPLKIKWSSPKSLLFGQHEWKRIRKGRLSCTLLRSFEISLKVFYKHVALKFYLNSQSNTF